MFVCDGYIRNICHTHHINVILWLHYLLVPEKFLSGILKLKWFPEISQQNLFKQLLAIIKRFFHIHIYPAGETQSDIQG